MSKASSILNIGDELRLLRTTGWRATNNIKIVLVSLIPVLLTLVALLIKADAIIAAKVIVVASVVIATIFVPPKYLIYAVVVYFPFETLFLKFLPESLILVVRYGIEVILIVALITLLYKRKMKSLSFTPIIDLPIALFFGVSILSGLINQVHFIYIILGLRSFFRFVPLYLIIINSELSIGEIKKMVNLLIIIAFVQACIGIIQFVIGPSLSNFLMPVAHSVELSGIQMDVGVAKQWIGSSYFVFGTLGRYNILGAFLVVFMILGIAIYYECRKLNLGLILFLLSSFVTLLLTTSRAALVGLAIGIFLIAANVMRRRIFLAIIVLGVIMLLLVFLLIGPNIQELKNPSITPNSNFLERFIAAIHPDNLKATPNSNFRLFLMFDIGKQILAQHPFFGLGIGTFGSLITVAEKASFYQNLGIRQTWLTMVADVEYINVLGQCGVLGLLSMICLFFGIMSVSIYNAKSASDYFLRGLSLGICGVMAAILAFNFAQVFLETRNLSLYFWIFAGMTVAIYKTLAPKHQRLEADKV